MRACAACRARRPASELLRFAGRAALVVPDLRRRLPGRGLNVCPTRACLRAACKRGAFKRGLSGCAAPEVGALEDAVVAALEEALAALLRDGRRSGAVRPVEAGQIGLAALEPLVLRGGVPPVVVEGDLARRITWIASALLEFTFEGPGGMNRRPAKTGALPGAREASSGDGNGAQTAAGRHE